MTTPRGQILVIDDSAVVLDQIATALRASGFGVKATSNLAEASRLAAAADLVLVDFHMPEMDGGKLLPSLRSAVGRSRVCLFYLYTSDVDVARTYDELGFDGGLIRKGDVKALLPQIDAAFRTIHMRKLAEDLRSARGRKS